MAIGIPKQFSTGEMRTVLTFRTNVPVKNSSGGYEDDYHDIYACRGRFRQAGGKRSLENGDIVRNEQYEAIVRYTTQIVVGPDTVVVVNGITYTIVNFSLVDNIQHYYRFILSAFQANG